MAYVAYVVVLGTPYGGGGGHHMGFEKSTGHTTSVLS